MAANIYTWVALAALFLALAVAPFTRRVRPRQARNDADTGTPTTSAAGEPATVNEQLPAAPLSAEELRAVRLRRSNRWTRFNFALSGFFAALTAGGFIVGFDAYYDPSLAVFAAIALAIFFVPVRFPRSVGVPAVIIVLALAAASPFLLSEWYPVRGSEPLAGVRILSLDDEAVRFEWVDREEIGDGTVHVVEGGGIAIGIREVEVPAQLFFAGAYAFVRVERIAGMAAANGERELTGDEVKRPAGSGAPGWVSSVLESGRIPGVRARELVVDLPRPVLLAEYVLEVDGEGGAAIERVSR